LCWIINMMAAPKLSQYVAAQECGGRKIQHAKRTYVTHRNF
jgi:hypothetical protein